MDKAEETRPSTTQTAINPPATENTQSHKKPKEKVKLSQEEIEKYKQQANIINPLFMNYYKENLNMPKLEFDSFISYSTKELPITFRISKINVYNDNLEEELNTIFSSNPEYQKRLKRHKFNFLDNIYELDTIDKSNKTDMKIKQILLRENDIGILRQELVAMIPVNLIPIEDDDIILDLCAAPGNKTVQALEIMEEKARQKGILPRGVIIANEIEPKRASNMSHFFKTQFPINIIVTSTPGQTFPLIKDPRYKPNKVICDVPCSGDGTLRKNKAMRKRWKLDFGYQNHPLQIALLDKAINECRNGGYVVYSTCAINPIENEAVVMNVLERYKDKIELVNVAKELGAMNIKYTEGLTKWKVCSNWEDPEKLQWVMQYSDIKENKDNLIKETMFHEIYTKENHESNVYCSDPLNLRRCVRIYSHQNNSGSFFIAILRKKENTQQEKESDYSIPLQPNEIKEKTIGEDLDDFLEYIGLERETTKKKENPVKDAFFATQVETKVEEKKSEKEDEILFPKYANIKGFKSSYENLNKIFNFTNDAITKYLYCPRESSHKIYLFSEKLVEMINIFTQMNIPIIRTGMIAFKKERQNFNTKYRLTHYGAVLLEGYLSNQKIELKNPEMLEMLLNDKDGNIQLCNVPTEYKETVDKMENGTIILIYDAYVVVCRKGKGTLALMIPKLIHESVQKYILETIALNKK